MQCWWRVLWFRPERPTPLESLCKLADRAERLVESIFTREHGMSKRKLSTFERLKQGKMNRKQRKEFARKLYSDDPGLEVVHRHVAGIDVGNESHFVAVSPGKIRSRCRSLEVGRRIYNGWWNGCDSMGWSM